MSNMVPKSASQILERALDMVRIRANANGECFGGEITDAMRDAGTALGVDRLEVLLIRTLLARTMESLGESYPTEVLQDYETRMPVSKALEYLNEAIFWTAKLKTSDLGSALLVCPPNKPEVPRCPYCVSEGQFRVMRVLENGRQICENCGHIIFPEDRTFWCPCQKCLEARFSPKLQKYAEVGPGVNGIIGSSVVVSQMNGEYS
jgi:hypothetical protein